MTNSMLYTFSKLSNALDDLGYPKLAAGNGFQLIKGVDFEKAYRAGSISFEDDGIYLEYEGKKYKGYMFIYFAYITYNGQPKTLPRFHIRKCTTIRGFIDSGRFNQRYQWSNSSMNNLVDRQTNVEYKDEVLQLCSYCSQEAFEHGVSDTTDFYNSLDKSELEEELVEVDINGYVRGKERISRRYRALRDYTCEDCGIKPESISDRRYWHVHHKNGDKTNNSDANLECLCVHCHANKDEHHQGNFNREKWRIEIEHFLKKYKPELT